MINSPDFIIQKIITDLRHTFKSQRPSLPFNTCPLCTLWSHEYDICDPLERFLINKYRKEWLFLPKILKKGLDTVDKWCRMVTCETQNKSGDSMIPKITTDCIVAVCDKAMSGDYADFVKESKEMIADEQPELFEKLRIMVPSSILGTQKICKDFDFW